MTTIDRSPEQLDAEADSKFDIGDRMTRSCLVGGCHRPYLAKGLCHTHYEYQRRHGQPVFVRQTEIDRFEKFVQRPADPNGCWEWIGSRYQRGYGAFRSGSGWYAHRFSYEQAKGPVPDGLQIDHLCRNRGCVNPDHLEAVTHQENQNRGLAARRSHCHAGHPYDEANTYIWRGARFCRACRIARIRKARVAA